MQKKLSILLILFILFFSCGNKKNSEGKNSDTSDEKSQKIDNAEIEKYNSHVNFYNKLVQIDENIKDYFEAAGIEKKLKKSEKVFPIPVINQNMIDEIKKNINGEVKMEELDNPARNLLPVLEEIKLLTDELQNYYKSEEHLKDGLKKGRELHLKFLEIGKKYSETSKAYKAAFEKKALEQRKKSLQKLEAENKLIKYNLIIFMDSGEKFLNEIQNQNLDFKNYFSGTPEKFKALQKEVEDSFLNLKKASEDENFLRKEKFQSSDFTSFMLYTERFIKSIETFIAQLEVGNTSQNREKNPLKGDTGTPENIFNEYNNIVEEYNKLLNSE